MEAQEELRSTDWVGQTRIWVFRVFGMVFIGSFRLVAFADKEITRESVFKSIRN